MVCLDNAWGQYATHGRTKRMDSKLASKSQANIATHWGLSATIDSILSLTKAITLYVPSNSTKTALKKFSLSFGEEVAEWMPGQQHVRLERHIKNSLVLLSVEESKSNSNCCIKQSQPPMPMECGGEETFSESVENVVLYWGMGNTKNRTCMMNVKPHFASNRNQRYHNFIETKKYTSYSQLLQPTSLVQSHDMELIWKWYSSKTSKTAWKEWEGLHKW